jgi:hypothetical protein
VPGFVAKQALNVVVNSYLERGLRVDSPVKQFDRFAEGFHEYLDLKNDAGIGVTSE